MRKAGQDVLLTPRAFDVLLVLLRNGGRVVEKQALFDAVWKDTFVTDNALTKVIKEIRQAIGDDASQPRYIETLPKRGYRFMAELTLNNFPAKALTLDAEVPGDGTISVKRPWSPGHKALLFAAVVTFCVAAVMGAFWIIKNRPHPQDRIDPINSIAVLPFVNEAGTEDLEYLCDGMTESLINGLSQVPGFSVKARSTVYRYKGKAVPPQQAGAELKVEGVLIGRIVHRGDGLLLYLSLVDVRTGNQIWGEQYNRKQANLVALQNEIARDVSKRLRLRLSGRDEQRLADSHTTNSEAYRAFLQGRFYWNKRTARDLQKSVEYFQQAVSIDPHYALAFSSLADAYSQLSNYGGAVPGDAMPKAKAAVLKALSLDETLAEPHTALGFILMVYDFDFTGAEREFRRAIEINPNYPTSHLYYAELLMYLARHEEALNEYRRALDIDPLSLIVNRMYGESLFYARKYDDSIAQLKKTLDLDAGFASAHYSLSVAYHLRGEHAASVAEFAKSQELIGQEQLAALARDSFAKGGWRQYLRAMTAQPAPIYGRATSYAALGEKDQALAALEQAFDAHEHYLIWIKVDPRLDLLRGDPRFTSLMRRVNL